MSKRNYHCESFTMDLPNGLRLGVRLRVDLEALARDLGVKAYFNRGKRSRLKNGIVEARIIVPGVEPGNRADL